MADCDRWEDALFDMPQRFAALAIAIAVGLLAGGVALGAFLMRVL